MPEQFRTEKDSMGEMKVPIDAYYGAQTGRAAENFPISDLRFNRGFIAAMGLIKWSCAEINHKLGILDQRRKDLIQQAATDVIDGKLDAQFVVDIFQTGSGTSTNMNTNEVIASRANEIATGKRGGKDPIHPNDDMRAAYARAAPSTPAYVAAEARSQNAMRNAAAGNAGSTSIMPSTVGTQPRNIYASAPAAPAPSLGSVPLTPVNTPGANPDLAIDSVTNAGPAQSTFVNEQPASTTLSQAITMQHGQSAMPIAMPQQPIQTNSPWIPRTP